MMNTDSSTRIRRRKDVREPSILSSSRFALLIVLLSFAIASAFTSKHPSIATSQTNARHPSASSQLCALPGFNNDNSDENQKGEKDWWNQTIDSLVNFFWKDEGEESNQNGATRSNQQSQPPSQTSEFFQSRQASEFYVENNLVDDEDDELPAGTSLLFKIPAKQLKPGGLRLFLMFYLMGMQNTPDQNTWRADQRLMSVNAALDASTPAEEKTYVLEMLYDIDRSGMLQIELIPSNPKAKKRAEIRIYRCGSRPSTSYLMQESVIVDGVLDELQNIAGEKSATTIPCDSSVEPAPEEPEIAEEDRLLITDPPNAIEAARESLAFS